jgi:lysine-ketoglutarate reductase/saccharopine dehydrogenase-like protein (TIGR00300 family)
MAFTLPRYAPPDFNSPSLATAPLARFERVEQAGVAPEGYHATSIFPEYLHLGQGEWCLVEESRMDCVVVLEADGSLAVKEFRHLKAGDAVACGRLEDGEEGIYVHTGGFELPSGIGEKFAFRTQVSRETSFSIDYDELYQLLDFERDNGFILWVLGPAVAFDKDARDAFTSIIDNGYVHGLLAGNALAVHDMEGSLFGTALGQELYSKTHAVMGHYKHLDAINKIRSIGSIEEAIGAGLISDGIMKATIRKRIPYVLAGSIRDDGPLPAVIADAYLAQDEMRALARRATTVVAMATQLHAIATGNMIPSYRVMDGAQVRPVYFYSVDMSEFAINKLANRGSLTARTILTNVQDFVVNLERGLLKKCRSNSG